MTDMIGLFSTIVTQSACKAIEIREKMQYKGYYARRSRSLKVIEMGANRKPVFDFLLVINSN